MAQLYEFYNPAYDGIAWISGGGTTRGGQTFTPQVAHILTSVKLRMYRSTTSLYGTLYCGIFATGAGKPTGAALVSATIDYSTMGTSWPGEVREIAFSPGVLVEAGTPYAIVLWMAGGTDNYGVYVLYKMVGSYAGGARVGSDNGGSTWSTTADDLWVEDWGEPAGKPCTIAAVSALIVRSSGVDFAPAWWPWTWPVVETLLFNTEILDSHDRTEQRIARHGGVPRSRYRTTVLLANDSEAAAFDAVMAGWLKRTWPVPLWPQASRHMVDLAAGIDRIELDTRYADFRDDSYGLIWQEDQYEIVKIASKTDAALVLATDLAQAFAGAKWIMPLRRGYLQGAAERERLVGGAVLVEMTWLVVDNAAAAGHTAPLVYDDLEVLVFPSVLEGGSLREVHDPDVAFLDAETGPFVVVSNSERNLVRQRHLWQCATAAQCWSLRQFLCALRGRQGAFLAPTFRDDLTLTRPVAAGDMSLYVGNGGFARHLGAGAVGPYVAIRPPPAEILVRKVAGLEAVSGQEERIDLDAAPGRAFAAGSGLFWVDKCRLADDAVEFQWQGHGELSCAVDLVRIP